MMPTTAIRSADFATVTVRMDDDDLVIAVAGELCVVSVPVLEAALESAFDTGCRVVVDLRDVTLLSAAGVNLFARLARQHGDRFGIVYPSGRARRTLALTQMEWLVVSTDDASIGHDGPADRRTATRDRSSHRASSGSDVVTSSRTTLARQEVPAVSGVGEVGISAA